MGFPDPLHCLHRGGLANVSAADLTLTLTVIDKCNAVIVGTVPKLWQSTTCTHPSVTGMDLLLFSFEFKLKILVT